MPQDAAGLFKNKRQAMEPAAERSLQELLDKCFQLRAIHKARILPYDFAVLIDDDRRDAADIVLRRDVVAFIHVVLGHHDLAGIGIGRFFHQGPQHAAGTAPRSPEVYKHGQIGYLVDLFIKIGVIDVADILTHRIHLLKRKKEMIARA